MFARSSQFCASMALALIVGCQSTAPIAPDIDESEVISAKVTDVAYAPALTAQQAALLPMQGRGSHLARRIRPGGAWRIEGLLAFWYPTIDGELTMKKGTGSFKLSESDALNVFDRGEGFIPVMISAKKDLFLVELDVIYADFDEKDTTDVTNSPTAISADTDGKLWLTNLRLGYQLVGDETDGNSSGTSLYVTGGIRYVHMEANIDIIDPGADVHVRNDEDFVSLEIGARLEMVLADNMTGIATVSLGNSENVRGSNAEVFAGIIYQTADDWTLGAGYQYMELEFEEGDLPDSGLKMRGRGPVVFIVFGF